MKAHYLGHVVFYVKDLERSLVFIAICWDSRRSEECSTAPLPRSRQAARITNSC